MVTLREITKQNHMECLHLKVNPDQVTYVAPNSFSLAQAMFHSAAWPLAIYADEEMVGFTMYCIDEDDGEYWVYRLMLDAAQQGKGYGRAALLQVIDRIRKAKPDSRIHLSIEPENATAQHLYETIGFRMTGRILEGEAEMVLEP